MAEQTAHPYKTRRMKPIKENPKAGRIKRVTFFRCIFWVAWPAISAVIVSGCAGPPPDPLELRNLPQNPLVQELYNQAVQGARFMPLYPPRRLAQADVTTIVEGWENKGSQDSNGQIPPNSGANMGGVFSLEGTSVFMLEQKGDTFVASSEIPAADGKITTAGTVWQEVTMAVGGGQVASIVLSGVAWTPRVVALGKLDLTGTGMISTSSDFNFDDFKSSPGVIPFANGYAINLFGQKINENGLVDANTHPKGNYQTDNGRPLYGHLVRSRFGKLEEIILTP